MRWAKIQINQQCRIRKMPRILPTKSILRLQVLLPLWRTLKLKNKQSSSPPFFSLQEFATLYFISNRHGHAHHLVKQPCEEKICFLWVYKKICMYLQHHQMKNELFVAVFLPVTFSIAKMSINHFLNRSEFFNSCEILYLLRSDGKK